MSSRLSCCQKWEASGGERITTAFLEDKAILEATEALVRRDARGASLSSVSVLCDRPAIQARLRVQQSLDQDAPS